MGPDPERSRGTRCRPAAGRSTSAGGRCSPCSPETQTVCVFGLWYLLYCVLLSPRSRSFWSLVGCPMMWCRFVQCRGVTHYK